MEPLKKKKQEDDELINSVMGSTNEEFNVNIQPNDLVKVRGTGSKKRIVGLLPKQLKHF